MKYRYKPQPKYKAFAAKWYNPLFWVAVLISFPYLIIRGIWEGLCDCKEVVKDILFKYDLS
jgi:hypothetical protein